MRLFRVYKERTIIDFISHRYNYYIFKEEEDVL